MEFTVENDRNRRSLTLVNYLTRLRIVESEEKNGLSLV